MNASRNTRDAELVVTRTIAAANANNVSTGIDLGLLGPPAALEKVEFEVSIPAIAANSDTSKNLTVQIRDSADNITFAAIPQVGQIVVAGVGTSGSAALTRKFRLPSTTRRYVGIYTAVDNGGPTLTASSVTLSVLA